MVKHPVSYVDCGYYMRVENKKNLSVFTQGPDATRIIIIITIICIILNIPFSYRSDPAPTLSEWMLTGEYYIYIIFLLSLLLLLLLCVRFLVCVCVCMRAPARSCIVIAGMCVCSRSSALLAKPTVRVVRV